MGIAFAGNMFTLFIFYEALTLSTYPLVVHKGTAEAKRGGRVYLGLLLGTSIGFQMVAIIWTRSEEHTSELQSLMRISYAVFCLKKKRHSTLDQQQNFQRLYNNGDLNTTSSIYITTIN